MLRHPCILGGPQTNGTKSEDKVYARGHHDAPRNKVWNQRLSGFVNSTGTLGPKRGRKCYVTPAFSGFPKQRGTKSEVKVYVRGHHDAPSIKAWIQRLSRFPQ